MSNTIIMEKDIIDQLMAEKPEISATDLKWKLFHFCKSQGLKSIGAHQYAKVDHVYDYKLGAEAEKINCILKTDYPEMKIAVWESRILNEWLNLLLAKNTIYIEVEKAFIDTLYDSLLDCCEDAMILVNPRSEEYYRYQKDGLIVLKTMVARAPVSKENHITLEKLFVDLICDKLFVQLFDRYTVEELIRNALRQYSVNEKKILAYAKRRGRYNEVLSSWRKIND